MNKNDSSKTVHSESCERDPLFEDAARLFIKRNNASTSLLQRQYEIGYNRANIKFAASLQTKSAKSKHDVNVIRRMPGRFLTFAVLKKKSTLL